MYICIYIYIYIYSLSQSTSIHTGGSMPTSSHIPIFSAFCFQGSVRCMAHHAPHGVACAAHLAVLLTTAVADGPGAAVPGFVANEHFSLNGASATKVSAGCWKVIDTWTSQNGFSNVVNSMT